MTNSGEALSPRKPTHRKASDHSHEASSALLGLIASVPDSGKSFEEHAERLRQENEAIQRANAFAAAQEPTADKHMVDRPTGKENKLDNLHTALTESEERITELQDSLDNVTQEMDDLKVSIKRQGKLLEEYIEEKRGENRGGVKKEEEEDEKQVGLVESKEAGCVG